LTDFKKWGSKENMAYRFMSSNGLITILLFLSIPLSQTVGIANRSLIIQVIILTSLLMMYGFMNTKEENKITEEPLEED